MTEGTRGRRSSDVQTDGLLAYCRAGYEAECAAEIREILGATEVSIQLTGKTGRGFVVVDFDRPAPLSAASRTIRLSTLVFARQILFRCAQVEDLRAGDRLAPLVAAIAALGTRFSEAVLETADTNDARRLSAFMRAFAPRLEEELTARRLLAEGRVGLPRLHLFFIGSDRVIVCASLRDNASPWPMGIPRIRASREAPSRSALKLAEAIMVLTGDEGASMRPGSSAVDLGAAPGGWSWILAQRGLRVLAVDNGELTGAVLETRLVEHVRADGFTFRPAHPVDWMTCDIADRPGKVTALVVRWFERGLCARCIFNLKLPMKKRLLEARRCLDTLSRDLRQAGIDHVIRAKHLYHDRDELTVYVERSGRVSHSRPRRRK